jgi:TolB protein
MHLHLSTRRLRQAAPTLIIASLALLLSSCNGDGDSSPEGPIVYERSDRGWSNIFVIDPENSETTQITQRESYDGNPSWSPDRQRIIFASDRDSTFQVPDLYVMDADGGNIERLTSTTASEWSPRFSPDGNQIAFAREDGDAWTLFVAQADGTGERAVAGPYKLVEFPDWTKDGASLIFAVVDDDSLGADLRAVDLATGDIRVIVQTPGADVCPHVTPDGARLIYASADDSGNLDLFMRDLSAPETDNSIATRLTDSPGRDDYGNPSPDGEHVVFVSDRDDDPELYIIDIDGANVRRLTETYQMRENLPNW